MMIMPRLRTRAAFPCKSADAGHMHRELPPCSSRKPAIFAKRQHYYEIAKMIMLNAADDVYYADATRHADVAGLFHVADYIH